MFKDLWLTWTPAFAGVTTFYECINIATFVKSLLCSHCESSEVMTDEMSFCETVIANRKVSQKQDISSDLQDKINPVHPVNPVRKIDG